MGRPLKLRLAAALPGWRLFYDPCRASLVALHRGGLWVEFDDDRATKMGPYEAQQIGRALRYAANSGASGHHYVEVHEQGQHVTVVVLGVRIIDDLLPPLPPLRSAEVTRG